MKRVFAVLLCAFVAIGAFGCGQTTGNNGGTASKVTNKQNTNSEFNTPDLSEEWKKYSLDDRAIQLVDQIYTPGTTLEEFLKKLENSSIKFENDYDPEKRVMGRKVSNVTFSYKGKECFKVDVYNPDKPSRILGQCVVTTIDPIEQNEDFYNSCRFIDGMSPEELKSIPLSEIKQWGEKKFAELDAISNPAAHRGYYELSDGLSPYNLFTYYFPVKGTDTGCFYEVVFRLNKEKTEVTNVRVYQRSWGLY